MTSDSWPVVGEGAHCTLGEVLDADTVEALHRSRPPIHIHTGPLSDDDLRALLSRLRAL